MHLWVLDRVGGSDKCLKEGVEVFVVLHVVDETGLHDALFDLFFVQPAFEGRFAAVRPVSFDDVGEEQEGGELELELGGLGVNVEQ